MTMQTITTRLSGFGRRDPYVTRLFGLLVALILLFAILKTDRFMSVGQWQSMGVQFPEFGLMSIGVMLTMIAAGIDLSVVGVANLAAISAASMMLAMAPAGASAGESTGAIVAAVGVALAVGLLAGLLNGVLVAKIRIPAILVTLGTLELFTGMAIIITQGKPISGLPGGYSTFVGSKLFGTIPMQTIIFLVAAIAVGALIHRSGYGKRLVMLGSNQTAAYFSGLRNARVQIVTYMLSGLLAAVAGLVMLGNYNSAKADYGASYTLLTVLIVVLAGVSPNGGTGRMVGLVISVMILQILSSGLNLFPEISNFYRPLLWGAVLLIVISSGEITDSRLWKRITRRHINHG